MLWKKSTTCFKSVRSGWNSFPQCCPLSVQARRLTKKSTGTTRWTALACWLPSVFFISQIVSSNIRGGRCRVMARPSACQSSKTSRSLSASTKKSASPVIYWDCQRPRQNIVTKFIIYKKAKKKTLLLPLFLWLSPSIHPSIFFCLSGAG